MRIQKKHIEFTKILAGACFFLGTLCIVTYIIAVFIALAKESSVNIDPSLAVTGLAQIVGAFLSYCLYQFGLKNSRNKYGIDADGQPFKTESEGNINGCL